MECYICYESICHADIFFLDCCVGKHVCTSCLQCLTVPLCPFCRAVIPEIRHDPRYRQSQSYVDVNHFLLMEQAHFMAHHGIVDESIDPRFIESRILRRRIRRLRRLQMRERRGSESDS